MGDNGNDIPMEKNMPGGSDIPPCQIYVDEDGRLWHQGAEMIHEGINSLLMEHVDMDDRGRYIIHFQGQRCYVDVADTFFVIRRVETPEAVNGHRPYFSIILNDGSREVLDPATLSQSANHVLYARVKEGRFPARFLRQSYYQLAEHVKEHNGRFFLPVNGKDYPLD
jgi:uncharacterized protein